MTSLGTLLLLQYPASERARRLMGDSVATPLVVGTSCLTGTRKEEFGVLFVKLTFVFLFFNYFF